MWSKLCYLNVTKNKNARHLKCNKRVNRVDCYYKNWNNSNFRKLEGWKEIKNPNNTAYQHLYMSMNIIISPMPIEHVVRPLRAPICVVSILLSLHYTVLPSDTIKLQNYLSGHNRTDILLGPYVYHASIINIITSPACRNIFWFGFTSHLHSDGYMATFQCDEGHLVSGFESNFYIDRI